LKKVFSPLIKTTTTATTTTAKATTYIFLDVESGTLEEGAHQFVRIPCN